MRTPIDQRQAREPTQWPRALLALALLACSPDSALAPPPDPTEGAKAPSGWHDDFTTFDSSAWFPRNAGKRDRDAWIDPTLAFVRDGMLHVRAEERDGIFYTVQLKHRDLVKRGTVTARVRCPTTKGWWAAVWLQTDNTFLRGGLEVDLWECHRNMGNNIVHAVHEYDTIGHVGFVQHTVPADLDAWHLVSVTLAPNKPIKFTLDGVETESPYVWPSNPVTVRVLVSGHVGSWAGTPDPTVWPDSALVDWIRYSTK